MRKLNYYICKESNNKIVDLDYNKFKGYDFIPKNFVKYDGIKVSKVVIIKPSLIEQILKKKIKKRLNLYLKLIIQFIENNDSSSDSSLREALNDLTRFKSIIKNKYKKYLDDKYLKVLDKKIAILEYEINSKMVYINEIEYEEEKVSHRRR